MTTPAEDVTVLADMHLAAFEEANTTLESADFEIDRFYGAGYAEKHPAVVAGYLQAVATFYLADSVRADLRVLASELELIKRAIAEGVRHE